MSGEKRRKAYLWGHGAESLAVLLLRLKGFSILAKRYAASGGEIDIIARRKNLIVFVEVKARSQLDVAREAITPQKVQRMSKAARAFLGRYRGAQNCAWRGDAVFLAPWKFPRHVPGAFELLI